MTDEDRSLLERFRERDESVLEEARALYGRYCRTCAGRILADPLDAEECFADALNAAWNSIPPNEPYSLRVYLGKLTRNAALNRLFAENRQKRGGGAAEAALSELSEVTADSAPGPEEAYELKELTLCVNEFLHGLPNEDQRLFILRYNGFMSMDEIARELGRSPHALSVRLSRIRKRLKKHLIERLTIKSQV
ncbi:MAG: sigma-70 family RNA polymerase sigma factor [Clostridia bacterium]|nr:sigma-70 family RNA polymerase sigma factor [Clostridia bacterium]